MGCGCKTKTGKKANKGVKLSKADGDVKTKGLFKMGLSGVLSIIIGTILLPIVWVVTIWVSYENVHNGSFSLNKIVKLFDKNKLNNDDDDVEEDINPDEYELVGVDKIND